MTNKDTVKEDYTFVTHTINGKPAECFICGISAFDHFHKAGTLPKEYEMLELQLQLAREGLYPPAGEDLRNCLITGYFGSCTQRAVDG